MNLDKLKINQFRNIVYKNFEYEEIEVVIYYLKSFEDILECIKYCDSLKFAHDNRLILVYEKGKKDLNRDKIIQPFKDGTYLDYVMKARMLCSLSKELSAFVFMKE